MGSCDSAFAIMTRRFMPPESVMIFESFLSQSDRSRSTFSMNAGSRGLPNSPRLYCVVFHTVSNMSVASSCGTSPIFVRAARKSRTMSCPSAVMVPADERHDAADDVDERGLAGAVRSEQREDLAATDLEVDVLEGVETRRVGL